ncbi:MAG: HAD-IA family hydrolase, partial [Anaerolineae bacterium]|nr:HAD-IA family hydrolase [Anaerolineae bacterium]
EEFYDGDWLYPEVVAAIRALHGRYRLALLSNAYAQQDEWLRKMFNVDVTTDFDVYVNSARVGICKPEPAIYELVLDELAVEPGQAIFLDDSLGNVDVAGALGIHTIHVVDPTLALGELEALLGHSIDSSG